MSIYKGNNENNTLIGSSASDQLYGYGGNDILNGRKGIDVLVGGTGDDTYIVDSMWDFVEEAFNAGTDTVKSWVDWSLGHAANVENLVLLGTADIDGFGNELDNTIIGNSGANLLHGGEGNDTLNGRSGVDAIFGETGNDIIKINEFNGDVIDGGGGNNDLLQINGADQSIDLSEPKTAITGIEAIKFAGAGSNKLTLTVQSVLHLSDESNELKVDGGRHDTVYLDAGWQQGAISGDYQAYTQQGATVEINTAMNVQITKPSFHYTVSDAATAAGVGGVFTPGVEQITIDLGGIAYNQSDSAGGVIDLTGFGQEDTLVIALHDGGIHSSKASYDLVNRSFYIYQSKDAHSNTSRSTSKHIVFSDRVSWQKSASTAKLISNRSFHQRGGLQIVGLPTTLAENHFVFV